MFDILEKTKHIVRTVVITDRIDQKIKWNDIVFWQYIVYGCSFADHEKINLFRIFLQYDMMFNEVLVKLHHLFSRIQDQ